MNAIQKITAVELAIPDDIAFDAWVGIGADLSTQRRNVDWMIADWLNVGQERFAGQVEFEFLADTLGIAPKRLKLVADTAKKFPVSQRAADLSIDHHAHVAALDAGDALTILRSASVNHWTPEETRIEVLKVHAHQPSMLRDDPEYDMLIAITRAWNRASVEVRQQAADLIAEANFNVIDA